MTNSNRPSSDPRRRVLLLSDAERPTVSNELHRLRPLLSQHAEIIEIDLQHNRSLADIAADFALVLGGDGSILRAAGQLGFRQIPVVGVNLGKLGFLADLSPSELLNEFPKICQLAYPVVEHLILQCSLLRGEQEIQHGLALNEVSILAGAPFAILEIDLYVDGQWVTTYSGDGLIVSTPVGSTAHNLSAGGPILRKDLRAVVISPISAHTLTIRPVVDSANRTYELRVPRPNPGTSLVMDGQLICSLAAGDRVVVQRAEPTFQMIEVPGHNYYRTLREKLGWGGRLPLADDQTR